MSLKAQLAKAKTLWNKGLKMKPDFDNVVTDGVYVGKLTKASVGESESSGRLQVSWAAIISGGEFKGERVNWWSGLKTEQNFMYLQRDIARLGKEVPEDINDLEEILKEIEEEKPSIRFKVKTDGEFTNIRVLKKLSSDDSPEEETNGEVPEDTDVEETVEEVVEDVQEVEEAEAEEAEETPILEVGVRVAFDLKGKETVGEVSSVDEESQFAIIKADDGKKYKTKVENLRPAPKAKIKK